MAFQIERVYQNDPMLRKKSRVSSKINSTDDNSTNNAWTGELSTEQIRLVTVWHLGRRKAEATLRQFDFDDSHFKTCDQDITMMQPFGNKLNDEDVDVDDDEEYENIVNNENIDDEDNINIQDSMDPPPSTVKHSMYVEMSGCFVHKSNAVNSVINKTSKTSKDRLKRVQLGVSVDIQNDHTQEINDSDLFFRLNDTVLGKFLLH